VRVTLARAAAFGGTYRPAGCRAVGVGTACAWRVPAEAASLPVPRRLRAVLADAQIDHDQAHDVLLAARKPAANAFEHARDPTVPFFDVTVHVETGRCGSRFGTTRRGASGCRAWTAAGLDAEEGRRRDRDHPHPEGTTVTVVNPLVGRSSTTATA
jgi:hypothetical protein